MGIEAINKALHTLNPNVLHAKAVGHVKKLNGEQLSVKKVLATPLANLATAVTNVAVAVFEAASFVVSIPVALLYTTSLGAIRLIKKDSEKLNEMYKNAPGPKDVFGHLSRSVRNVAAVPTALVGSVVPFGSKLNEKVQDLLNTTAVGKSKIFAKEEYPNFYWFTKLFYQARGWAPAN